MKELLEKINAAELEANRIDKLWEADPDNAELEAQWDAAYKSLPVKLTVPRQLQCLEANVRKSKNCSHKFNCGRPCCRPGRKANNDNTQICSRTHAAFTI